MIFGTPGGSGSGDTRQLVAQSLWTQTFTYTGMFPVDITLHLHVPDLQVGLLGVPPRRTGISAAETAQAMGSLVRSITHPDLTIEGGHIEFGLSESEEQIPSGPDLLNIGVVNVFGSTGIFTHQAPRLNGVDFNSELLPLASFSGDVDLGVMHDRGHPLLCLYAHRRGHHTRLRARLLLPSSATPSALNAIGDNLTVTVTPVGGAADAPEATTCLLMLSGLAAVGALRRATAHAGRFGGL